ncbi:MAG: galactokinase [Firmicutes bacterium]|nr:galactokinase [Bacillota bacterium]
MNKNYINEHFTKVFDNPAEKFFFSPGRVNLIGEHTDYNGGHAFPCALSFGTYSGVRKRDDNKIRLISGNFSITCEINVDENIQYKESHNWANYPKGVILEMLKLGCKIGGFDLYIWGDIPSGAGLSSSASVEMLTATTINELFDCKISTKELVLLSRRAENNFVGVNCGVMDQYAVGFGKPEHAILLDCQAISHENVPLILGDYIIIITNTNNSRSLATSEYNQRHSECESALKILQAACNVEFLCALDVPTFEQHKHLIKDEILLNRATHVVYENARTIKAVDLLNAGDLASFGKLMTESHISLRDLYEVTGNHLDTLAEAAWQVSGVLGSRMTGAGFGGCTVSLVHKNNVDNFQNTVAKIYQKATGLEPSFYVAKVGSGAVEI